MPILQGPSKLERPKISQTLKGAPKEVPDPAKEAPGPSGRCGLRASCWPVADSQQLSGFGSRSLGMPCLSRKNPV